MVRLWCVGASELLLTTVPVQLHRPSVCPILPSSHSRGSGEPTPPSMSSTWWSQCQKCRIQCIPSTEAGLWVFACLAHLLFSGPVTLSHAGRCLSLYILCTFPPPTLYPDCPLCLECPSRLTFECLVPSSLRLSSDTTSTRQHALTSPLRDPNSWPLCCLGS